MMELPVVTTIIIAGIHPLTLDTTYTKFLSLYIFTFFLIFKISKKFRVKWDFSCQMCQNR
nr:MAG TPA: hypothetical protein [Caudoviricetes sp.]